MAALVVGAAPVMWWVTVQSRVERGEAEPDAAVNLYVLHLSSGERLGLSHALDDGRHDELLEQRRAIRAEMDRTDPPPNKVETVGRIEVEDQGDDQVVATARVRGISGGTPPGRERRSPAPRMSGGGSSSTTAAGGSDRCARRHGVGCTCGPTGAGRVPSGFSCRCAGTTTAGHP